MMWSSRRVPDPVSLAGGVHVWRAIIRGDEPWAALEGLLLDDELDRAGRFLPTEARRQFVFARAALRWVLGGYLGCPPRAVAITEGELGKPELGSASALRFNLSHAGALVLIAVGLAEVGVDVERDREGLDPDRLAPSVCTPAELAVFSALPREERRRAFLELWTRKEAVLKAAGVGLTIAPTRVHVSLPAPAHFDVSLSGAPRAGPYRVRGLAVGEGYAAAVAQAGGDFHVAGYALEPFTG